MSSRIGIHHTDAVGAVEHVPGGAAGARVACSSGSLLGGTDVHTCPPSTWVQRARVIIIRAKCSCQSGITISLHNLIVLKLTKTEDFNIKMFACTIFLLLRNINVIIQIKTRIVDKLISVLEH